MNTRIATFIMAVFVTSAICHPARAQSIQSQVRGPIANVKFAIYDKGIYPLEVYVPGGTVAISIEDLSAGTNGVMIDRVEGNSYANAASVQRNSRGRRGKSIVTLEPGEYEVYSLENPNVRSRLIVKTGQK